MQFQGPSDSEQQGPTAFRLAEKQYQLHWQQEIRVRKGRRRGGKLTAVPTDLSGVLDFLVPETWERSRAPVQRAHSPVLQADIFTLADTPGFYAMPGALSGEQQQRLAQAALQEYPEPPSRSNHSAAHGPLPRLWEAAQLDLRLAHAGDDSPRCCSEPQGCARQPSGDHTCSSGSSPRQREDPGGCCHSCGGRGPCDSGVWSREGPGPSARHLLSTLRWVTLGPQYCWTARAYDRLSPHTPLPPQLAALAQRFAAAAAELDAASAACAHEEQACTAKGHAPSPVGSSVRLPEQSQICTSSMQTASAEGCSHALEADSLGAVGAALEQHLAPVAQHCWRAQDRASCGVSTPLNSHQSRVWEPDVALVNLYREGDTLGGHQDDVERDKEAPIVAISLGCDAIFLLGGHTKADAPTAMWLRGGDVVVMAGAARQRFHGVPRVFAGQTLLQHSGCSMSNVHRGCCAISDEMQRLRINISIRSAA